MLDRLTPDAADARSARLRGAGRAALLASMGIYVVPPRRARASCCVGTTTHDFGKEIIPAAIGERRVFAFALHGLLARHRDDPLVPRGEPRPHAPAAAAQPLQPRLPDLHAPALPARARRSTAAEVEQSILCEGSIITGAEIAHSIVGIRAIVRAGRGDRGQHRDGRALLRAGRAASARHPARHRPRLRDPERDRRPQRAHRRRRRAGQREGRRSTRTASSWCIRGGIIVVPRGRRGPAGHGGLRARAGSPCASARRLGGRPVREDRRPRRRVRGAHARYLAPRRATTCGPSCRSTRTIERARARRSPGRRSCATCRSRWAAALPLLRLHRAAPGRSRGPPVYFVDCPRALRPRGRSTPAGPRRARALRLPLARGARVAASGWASRPDVVHAHDWHTALVPLYLKHALRLGPACSRARRRC